jgi:hypothetical protein
MMDISFGIFNCRIRTYYFVYFPFFFKNSNNLGCKISRKKGFQKLNIWSHSKLSIFNENIRPRHTVLRHRKSSTNPFHQQKNEIRIIIMFLFIHGGFSFLEPCQCRIKSDFMVLGIGLWVLRLVESSPKFQDFLRK